MNTDNLIKISDMASLHGVSRQTLILYDKNGLLSPRHISETGYRYYSPDQIPRLRQICLLKELGVPLRAIKAHLDDCSVESMRTLLASRKNEISDEIAKLERQLEGASQLEELYEHVETHERNAGVPHVIYLPKRTAIVAPYPEGGMDNKRLHLALMNAWGSLLDANMIPSKGFGSILLTKSLDSDKPLEGAGSIVMLPEDRPIEGANTVTLPEGEYAVMYKYSMPYDVEPARELLAWMRGRGLTPAEGVIDRCLLDTMFHGDAREADFCRLEIRVVS